MGKGRTLQMVVQYQVVSPKNMHIGSIIQTKQAYLEIYVHMHSMQ